MHESTIDKKYYPHLDKDSKYPKCREMQWQEPDLLAHECVVSQADFSTHKNSKGFIVSKSSECKRSIHCLMNECTYCKKNDSLAQQLMNVCLFQHTQEVKRI